MQGPAQPASINGIEFDVLISRTESLEATVPSYPTEKGYQVSDSIIVSPLSLEVTVFVTDTPVTWKQRFGERRSAKAVCDELKRLFFSKQLVTLRTSDETYTNMGITSISLPRTAENGKAYEIPIRLQEVPTTEAKTVAITVSYSRGGGSGSNAGTANTSATSSGASGGSTKTQSKEEGKKSSSILYGVASSVGLMK